MHRTVRDHRDDLAYGTAQTLLRHANLNTTAIYIAVADEKRYEAIDRLSID